MLKHLRNFGAIFAGFELALKLVGFFGIGALAKWVVEEWVPFTRWVWTELLSYIQVPDLNDPEKDALTTVAFFAPLAIWSAVWYLTHHREQGTYKYRRVMALSLGVLFFIIVGRNLIIDVISTDVLPFGIRTEFMMVVLNVVILAALAVQMSFSAMSSLLSSISGESDEASGLIKTGRRMRNLMLGVLVIVAAFYVFLLILNGPNVIGWIRLMSFFMVVVFLAMTIMFDPERMSVVFGALIAFVLTSLAYDLLVVASRFIQDAPGGG